MAKKDKDDDIGDLFRSYMEEEAAAAGHRDKKANDGEEKTVPIKNIHIDPSFADIADKVEICETFVSAVGKAVLAVSEQMGFPFSSVQIEIKKNPELKGKLDMDVRVYYD